MRIEDKRGRGRPVKSYDDLSDRSKRRRKQPEKELELQKTLNYIRENWTNETDEVMAKNLKVKEDKISYYRTKVLKLKHKRGRKKMNTELRKQQKEKERLEKKARFEALSPEKKNQIRRAKKRLRQLDLPGRLSFNVSETIEFIEITNKEIEDLLDGKDVEPILRKDNVSGEWY